ncbi:DUF5412 family protein [Virgibacillus sediminis]|uniref:DUF5412 family protein n=1 Tax=Virgibacillus sediminis TaxID=202260 RepID=A0ABV7A8I8_9BACI
MMNAFILISLVLTILIFIIFGVQFALFLVKKDSYPKKSFLMLTTGLLISIGLIGYKNFFFTFDGLKGEFFQGPLPSPTEKYTANAYYETYGGAAGGVNVWVDISFEERDGASQTIYFSDAKSGFSMEWKDEDTLEITNEEPGFPSTNRSMELDVEKEIYHDSGLACGSWLMMGEYEACYQN